MVISTEWGKSLFLQAVNRWSPYTVKAEKIDLTWLGKQKVSGLEVAPIFRCQSATSDATLLHIGFKRDFGTLNIVEPKVVVEARLGPAPSVAFAQAGFIPDFRPSFNFSGNITVEKGEAEILSPGYDPAYFQNIRLDAEIPKAGPIRFFASGKTEQSGTEGSFNVTATLDKVLNAKATLVHFPVRGLAAAITGAALDLNLDIEATEESMQATIDASSPQFSAHFKAGMSGESVTLTTPGTVDFKITSALIPGLRQEATAHIDIASFQMPLAHKEQFSFQSKVSLSTLPLAQYTFQPMTLDISSENFETKKIAFHFDSPQLQIPDLEFYWETPYRFVGKEFVLTLDVQKIIKFNLASQIAPQGKLLAQGSIDSKTLSSQINVTAQQFPTSLLDKFVNLPASGLLGAAFDMTASAHIQNGDGTVDLTLESPTTRTAVKGTVTGGILTLNESVYAQITPQFPHIHPQNPLSIEIPAKGVSLSLFPFSMDKINIPNMRIELGKVRAENEGNLNFAVTLLKLSQFGRGGDLRLWFAPIDLQIKNGVIDCERTEVLAENAYQVCFWGKVNLPQNNVDMILGLTASCLKKAFGIKNLPEKYLLQIPVRGTLSDIEIDTGKATGKVASLLLWQQKSLAGAAVGGPAGALLGGLLDKLGPLPDEESNAPPPKRPFPWEKESSKAEDLPKKKKHFHKEDKPLQQLLQMLK